MTLAAQAGIHTAATMPIPLRRGHAVAIRRFDREGAQVMGVSIENHNLQPGETTNVFVIRQEATR